MATSARIIDTLKRELKEELGIDVLATEPLMSVPQHTGSKSIMLDVFKVTTGTLRRA